MARPSPEVESATYIDRIMANGKELVSGKRLKPFQNYLQFQVSTPFFSPYSNLTYQYRIKNSPDSSWQRGSPRQTLFDLVALEPGRYEFEIVATDDSRKIVSQPAVYQFEIEPPWYKTWAFRTGLLVVVAAASFLTLRHYYQDRLRKQRLEYQKILAVQAERQRISAEIHDDIGAGLSAIRLLSELTTNRLPEGETKQAVGKIHASISALSTKMREVIWSLNTDNDKLDNLLYYLRRQALLLFENSPIQLSVSFPTHEIPPLEIKGEKRRHIYLAVKEALHNCLKHSGARHCQLSMHLEAQSLHITVADDGTGFLPPPEPHTGSGVPGMKKRMQQIKGSFALQSQNNTTITFVIPLLDKHE
jgi:signal transduction histidine kinase